MGVLRACAVALLVSVSSGAVAADWIVDRARGDVRQWEGGQWVALQRGDAIPDARKIRTGADGRVDLMRGQERISLASNSEIAIQDAGEARMTSVLQSFGSVSIEAERRNVQHFSVQTPVLAAVVKGTQFRVTYANGRAEVLVDRGVVQVQDTVHDMVADVQRGQSAEVAESVPLDVSGPGSERTVYLVDGQAVTAEQRDVIVSGGTLPETAANTETAAPAGAVVALGNDGVSASAGGDNGNGNGLALGVGNGNGPGNGNGNGPGNGNGVSAGVGNGNGNGVSAGVGNGNGNGVNVGTDNGVSVSVDAVGVGVGVGSGSNGNSGNSGPGSSNSGSGNSGSNNGNSGNGGPGNSGSGGGGLGLGVGVDTGLGIGLRL